MLEEHCCPLSRQVLYHIVMVPVLEYPGAVMASALDNVVGLGDVFVFFFRICGSDYCRTVLRLLTVQ